MLCHQRYPLKKSKSPLKHHLEENTFLFCCEVQFAVDAIDFSRSIVLSTQALYCWAIHLRKPGGWGKNPKLWVSTLPDTTIPPENSQSSQKGNESSSNHQFSGAKMLLVSGKCTISPTIMRKITRNERNRIWEPSHFPLKKPMIMGGAGKKYPATSNFER